MINEITNPEAPPLGLSFVSQQALSQGSLWNIDGAGD